jgi:hypothetical protein
MSLTLATLTTCFAASGNEQARLQIRLRLVHSCVLSLQPAAPPSTCGALPARNPGIDAASSPPPQVTSLTPADQDAEAERTFVTYTF